MDGSGTALPRVTFPAEITLNAGSASVDISLLGPGEISGIDPRAVVRTWPKHDIYDAEPNYFPMCEFADADFPWRYTPAGATSEDRLRPWICLIVLTDDEIAETVPAGETRKLPSLRTKPGVPLPDLRQSWAWAHTQVSGVDEIDAATTSRLLDSEPQRFVSRLLCPRYLKEGTAYTAFLVPTFERGRLAGLGEPVPEDLDGTAPAWTSGMDAALELPVYYQWRFQTSTGVDYEVLVRRLQPRAVPESVGLRFIDASNPGAGLPPPEGGQRLLAIEGALRSPATKAPEWQDSDRSDFVEGLRALLNLPAELLRSGGSKPVVAPPLYASSQSAHEEVLPGTAPAWFAELNLDPRLRVAAGLGTLVVQEQQQALMAGAWARVEGIRVVNEQLGFAQLAREISIPIYENHVLNANPDALLQVTAPLLSKIKASPMTMYAALHGGAVPRGLLDPQFRRISRPRGPQARRQGRESTSGPQRTLERANRGELSPPPPPSAPKLMATPERAAQSLVPSWATPAMMAILARFPLPLWIGGVLSLFLSSLLLVRGGVDPIAVGLAGLGIAALKASSVVRISSGNLANAASLRAGRLTPDQIRVAQSRPDFVAVETTVRGTTGAASARSGIPPSPSTATPSVPAAQPTSPAPVQAPTTRSGDTPSALAFRFASARTVERLRTEPPPSVAPARVDLPKLTENVAKALDPRVTITSGIRSRLVLASNIARSPRDPLDPVVLPPEFPQPMYKPLVDLSQEWLLPGLDHVPDNTVSLLQTNQRFVEAYMAGLTHEMGRELLWNEYPTDPRATYFRQFWDPAGYVPPAGQTLDSEALKDITPIASWEGPLGENTSRRVFPEGDPVVLLIRGDVVRRYPTIAVYAVKARWGDQGSFTSEPTASPPAPPRRSLGTEERRPLFSGALPPDVVFCGFDLGTAEALGSTEPGGDPGWFFVLQEQQSEPRFGLDLPPGTGTPSKPPESWNDISWAHLVSRVEDLDAFNYIDLFAELPDTSHVADPHGPGSAPPPPLWPPVWHGDARGTHRGSTAADVAYITLQRPVRIAIHASDMLPSPGGS